MSSTTATSLVPSSIRASTPGSALKSTRNTISREIASTTGFIAGKAQDLGLTPSSLSAAKIRAKTNSFINNNRPSTPYSTPNSTSTPSPGRFRHPRTTEILARSSATSLSDTSVKIALTNIAALLVSYLLSDLYYGSLVPVLNASGGNIIGDPIQILSTVMLIFRLVVCANIVNILRPAIPYLSKKDEISDIPLTPSQRSLLGLKPSSSSSSPSAQSTPSSSLAAPAAYVTPPRYRRSSGSFSGSPSGSGVSTDRRSISATYYSSSPLSASRYNGTSIGFSTPSQSVRRNNPSSDSPFSPSPAASPLFHKARNQSTSAQNPELDFKSNAGGSPFGTSIGAGGPGLNRSQSLREKTRRESIEPNNSPSSGTRSPQVVPGLNYKWLYDKGRKLPKSESYGF